MKQGSSFNELNCPVCINNDGVGKALALETSNNKDRRQLIFKLGCLLSCSLLSVCLSWSTLCGQPCVNQVGFTLNYNSCGSVVIVNTTVPKDTTLRYGISWGDGMVESKVKDWDTFYHSYAIRKTYAVTLEMLDTASCKDDTTITIVLPPQAKLAFTSTHICEGDTYTFPIDTLKAKNLDSVVQFIVDYDDQSKPDTSNSFNFLKVYNKAGLYRVTVDKKQKVQGNHCVDKDYPCPQLKVYPKPKAEFDAPDTVYVRQKFFPIDFSVLDTSVVMDSITQFFWMFGDGNSYAAKPGEKVSYAYQKPGIYDITLTVTTKEGSCSHSYVKPIVVCPKPTIQFSTRTPCKGQSTLLINETIDTCFKNGLSYFEWDFNDGSAVVIDSTKDSTTHVFAKSGTYQVRLKAYVGKTGLFCDTVIGVKIFEIPNTNVSIVDSCFKDGLCFTNNSTLVGDTFDIMIWNFGGGNVLEIPFKKSFCHKLDTPGTYHMIIISRSRNGCLDSQSNTVVLHPSPIASFLVDSPCSNQPAQFTNLSTIDSKGNITNYKYNFGDGKTGNTASPDHLYANPGTYKARLTVTSTGGCTDVVSDTLVVYPSPSVAFSSVSTVCARTNVIFNNTSTSTTPVNWLWDFGDNSSSVSQQDSHSYSINASNRVVLTAQDTNSCIDSMALWLDVLARPVATYTHRYGTICEDSILEFKPDSLEKLASYKWHFGDGVVDTNRRATRQFSLIYKSPTKNNDFLDLRLVSAFPNGCRDSVSFDDLIKVVYRPKSIFSDTVLTVAPGNRNDCYYRNSGKEILFKSDSSLWAKSFVWNFGDNTSNALKANPTHRFKLPPKGIEDSFRVRLRTLSKAGCYHDTFKYMGLKALPVVRLDTVMFRLCEGESFLIKPLFKDSGATLTWRFSDNTSILGDSANKVVSMSSGVSEKDFLNLELEAVFKTAQCTTQLEIQPIAVIHQLSESKITLTSTDTFSDHCYPFGKREMVFSSDLSKNVKKVKWDFDGGTTSGNTVQFQLKDSVVEKDFEITLTTSNALGCMHKAIRTVTIKASPRVSIGSVKTEVCEGDRFCLEPDTLQLYGDYTWHFSDGSTIKGEKICREAFIYGNEGVGVEYLDIKVHLRIDSNGCEDIKEIDSLIKIHEAPTSRFEMETLKVTHDDCYALGEKIVSFNSDFSVNANSLVWYFGDGSSSAETHPQHTYRLDTGSIDSAYLVSLVVKNALGCTDSTTKTVRVKRLPLVVFDTLKLIRVCTTSDTCRTPWIWQKGAVYTWATVYNGKELNRSIGRKFCTKYPSPDSLFESTYLGIKLITELPNGCSDSLFADSLVKSYKEIDVNFSFQPLDENTDSCYKNGEVEIRFNSNASSFAKEVYWDYGDGSNWDDFNPKHVYRLDGVIERTYTVKVVMKNKLGCPSENTQSILIKSKPNVAFDSTKVTICEGSEICFHVDGSAIANTVTSYHWKFRDGVVGASENYCRTFEASPQLPWRDVTLVLTSDNGCVDSLHREKYLLVKKKPKAMVSTEEIDKNQYGTAIPYGKIKFSDESKVLGDTLGITNVWTLGDGSQVSNMFNFSHRYQNNDQFNINYVLVDTNGCSDTTYLTLEPRFFRGLQVPNALAPVSGIGDGRVFKVKGVGLKDYQLEIYNEQGVLIFETTQLDPFDGSPLKAWDGKIDGEYAEQGIYFWKVFAVFENGELWPGQLIGEKYCKTGSIVLLR